MSVTSENRRVQVTLSGAGQAIPVNFYFLEDADLLLVKTVDGVDSALVLNTNYTVAGAGDPDGGMIAMIGGASGDIITVVRNDALTQEEEFLYMGALVPTSIERAYDRIVMQLQRILLMSERSIRLPVTASAGGELPDLATRKGKTMQFNATTGALELVSSAESSATAAAVSAAAALVSETNAAISAAAALAFAGAAYTSATGGSATALDSAITVDGATPTRSLRYVQTGSVGGGDLAIQTWSLQAGTNAEDGVSYVRPDDYNGATNAKVWVRVG